MAYPANSIKKGGNLQAAAFSVSRLKEANTANECLSVVELFPHVEITHTETINGAKFSVTQFSGVASGNLLDGYYYRSFHRKICYELGIRVAFSNLGNYDPATVKTFDLEEVRRTLKDVLGSFKFLK